MYQTDSFFTLSSAGQVGLLAVSVVLAGLILWGLGRLARGRSVGVRLAVGLGGFVCFVWLSPQVYYGYYLLIFDGLPLQWVIAGLPDPVHAARLALFLDKVALSEHAQGLFCWACTIWCVLRRT